MRISPLARVCQEGGILMNHNSEYLPGSASLPTSPVAPVAPSSAVASRLARSFSDSQADKGTTKAMEYESDDTESSLFVHKINHRLLYRAWFSSVSYLLLVPTGCASVRLKPLFSRLLVCRLSELCLRLSPG